MIGKGYKFIAVLALTFLSACQKPVAVAPANKSSNTVAERPVAEQEIEHAILVNLKLSDKKFGSPEERTALLKLGDQLAERVANTAAGEYDGHEWGEGYCTLYLYGPDANALYDSIIDGLRIHKPRPGLLLSKDLDRLDQRKKDLSFNYSSSS